MTSVLMTPDGKTVEAEAATARSPGIIISISRVRKTSTNSIASIFAWTRGLTYRAKIDDTPAVGDFAKLVEKICVDTVEGGQMTKDLALLIGPDQTWLTTEGFLEAVATNLEKAMA